MSKELYSAWMHWKKEEDEAKKNRIKIEKMLIGEKEAWLEDGKQRTFKSDRFKCTIKLGSVYKLDEEKYFDICKQIPEKLRPVEYKAALNKREYENIRKYHPEIFDILSQAVEVKPTKPSVKVEVLIGE